MREIIGHREPFSHSSTIGGGREYGRGRGKEGGGGTERERCSIWERREAGREGGGN